MARLHDGKTKMRHGAVHANGSTHFSLWAPAVDAIEIELQSGERHGMTPADGGWFEKTLPCEAGTGYRYRLINGMHFPDPASRNQSRGVHGWSVVTDPAAYRWRYTEWQGRPWHEAVIYELHAGVMGGYAGIREFLPSLQQLGVTAVELMPIADFPGARNWGYDGVLLFAPAEAYGTPDELKQMIDEAHGLGMMVFLDVVYNHFGPEGNYLPIIAPVFFLAEIETPWGGALAFDNANVADYFAQNALYWLNEFRFDGLRLDAVHAINPTTAFMALGIAIRDGVDPKRHVHLVLENERNDASLMSKPFDAQWNDDFHHCIHVLLTGESEVYYSDYSEDTTVLLARCLQSGFAYQGEVSRHLGRQRGTPSGDLPTTAFVSFIHNHDQIGNRAMGERLTSLADPDGVRAAVALLLLCPHIPMIFMGDETGTRSPFLFFTDFSEGLADAVRRGRREEFKDFAAFRDAATRERIPDPNDQETFRLSNPTPASDGFDWQGFYRALLSARAEHVTPQLIGAKSMGARAIADKAVVARWCLADGGILTIAANLGVKPIAFQHPSGHRLLCRSRPGDMEGLPAFTTLVWTGRG